MICCSRRCSLGVKRGFVWLVGFCLAFIVLEPLFSILLSSDRMHPAFGPFSKGWCARSVRRASGTWRRREGGRHLPPGAPRSGARRREGRGARTSRSPRPHAQLLDTQKPSEPRKRAGSRTATPQRPLFGETAPPDGCAESRGRMLRPARPRVRPEAGGPGTAAPGGR